MITLYGIKTCSTVRQVRKWLDQQTIPYCFHDFRENGLDSSLLDYLEQALGWECTMNRRSTSWRNLDDSEREDLTEEKAKKRMIEHPTLIKRPILDTGEEIIIGYSADEYQCLV